MLRRCPNLYKKNAPSLPGSLRIGKEIAFVKKWSLSGAFILNLWGLSGPGRIEKKNKWKSRPIYQSPICNMLAKQNKISTRKIPLMQIIFSKKRIQRKWVERRRFRAEGQWRNTFHVVQLCLLLRMRALPSPPPFETVRARKILRSKKNVKRHFLLEKCAGKKSTLFWYAKYKI